MGWLQIFILGGLALLIPTAYAGWIGAPYAPTRLRAVRRAFDEIELGEGDALVDLGVGDGSIVLEAARRGARAQGYELSPIMWTIARIRAIGKQRAAIKFGNFYKKPLADATVVFAFLMPNNMSRVLEYLRGQQVPKGKYFLAYAFPFPDIEPLTVIKEENCAALYVYDLQALVIRNL